MINLIETNSNCLIVECSFDPSRLINVLSRRILFLHFSATRDDLSHVVISSRCFSLDLCRRSSCFARNLFSRSCWESFFIQLTKFSMARVDFLERPRSVDRPKVKVLFGARTIDPRAEIIRQEKIISTDGQRSLKSELDETRTISLTEPNCAEKIFSGLIFRVDPTETNVDYRFLSTFIADLFGHLFGHDLAQRISSNMFSSKISSWFIGFGL